MPGFGPTMDEFKRGALHSGSKQGPKVKKRAQAIAIALSEERAAGKSIPKNAKGSAISGAIRKHLGKKRPGEAAEERAERGRGGRREERMEGEY